MIRSRLLPVVAALFLAFAAGPVMAQTIDAGDQARIQARIDALGATIRAGDLTGGLDAVPPRLLDAVSARFGVPRDQLEPAMRQVLTTQLQGVTIDDYGMDLAGAETHVSGDRTWLLIPTWTEMTVEGVGRVRFETRTLALEDDGEWYLVRVEDAPQAAMLREVYPEFAEVEFPAGVVTRLP
jgi:hypothetical protein